VSHSRRSAFVTSAKQVFVSIRLSFTHSKSYRKSCKRNVCNCRHLDKKPAVSVWGSLHHRTLGVSEITSKLLKWRRLANTNRIKISDNNMVGVGGGLYSMRAFSFKYCCVTHSHPVCVSELKPFLVPVLHLELLRRRRVSLRLQFHSFRFLLEFTQLLASFQRRLQAHRPIHVYVSSGLNLAGILGSQGRIQKV